MVQGRAILFAMGLTLTFGASLFAQGSARAITPAAQGNEFQMTAKKYGFNPNVITVKQGSHVKLVITATDRDHGFKLAAYDINQRLKRRVPTTVEFDADHAGTFRFECSVVCGAGHHRMKGKLIVEAASPSSSP